MDDFACIDLTGYMPSRLLDQPQPMLIWAALEDLVIDRRYQRTITARGRGAIQKMADNFDWRKFQPIVVAPTGNGKLAVVDGQHRAHAAALLGLATVPAMTVAMTLVEQAAGFAAINRDRVSVHPLQIYRAERAAGTPWAVACAAVVEAGGCRLATANPSASKKVPGVIYGVGMVRCMVAAGEGAVISTGLRAIVESGQSGTIEAYGGPVLKCWLDALARDQRFLALPLAVIFDSLDIVGLLRSAVADPVVAKVSARERVIEQICKALRAALPSQPTVASIRTAVQARGHQAPLGPVRGSVHSAVEPVSNAPIFRRFSAVPVDGSGDGLSTEPPVARKPSRLAMMAARAALVPEVAR